MSNGGGNKPKDGDILPEEEFEIVQGSEVINLPDSSIFGMVDLSKGITQDVLYPDDIDHILGILDSLYEKFESLIRQFQNLKYYQDVKVGEVGGGERRGVVMDILQEIQAIQVSLETYVQNRGMQGPMKQFANLNQEIKALISTGEISDGNMAFLSSSLGRLKDYFESEKEAGVENAAEQGEHFSNSLACLIQEIEDIKSKSYEEEMDLIEGNRLMISCVERVNRLIKALGKNTRLTTYLKVSAIQPINDVIMQLGSAQPILDLTEAHIEVLQKKTEQFISFFAQEVEKKQREGSLKLDGGNNMMTSQPIGLPEERTDPAEVQRKIVEIRELIEGGRKREAIPLIETICSSFQAYQRLWDETNPNRRSFMNEKDSMHPLVETFLVDFFSSETMSAEHASTRVLELGPGIGNDALNWIKYMPNLKHYLGWEASKKAADIARARITNMLSKKGAGIAPTEWHIEPGDFVKRIQGAAQGLEQVGGRMSDVTTVITSISTLHYFWQPVFREILRSIHEILFHSRGYLVMALKTPESASFKEHALLESTKGYKVGIHREEGILRAFMTPEEINKMLDEKGFDMTNAITFPKVIEGYDHPGDKEVFWNIIVKPKKIKR